MNVCIIGTGYVGLVTGTCLADLGHHVTCMDISADKIKQLQSGKSPIYEQGLDTLLAKNGSNRLTFTTDLKEAVGPAKVIFVTVDTPTGDDGKIDTTNFFKVIDSLAPLIKERKADDPAIIVNKSTVPVGTGKKVRHRLTESGVPEDTFSVISNPEFLREGTAVQDFFHPDRIVVGGTDPQAVDTVVDLYTPLYLRKFPIIKTNLETAELIKYASNAFLATKISFINEMANLCDRVGADVQQVAEGMGRDGRIGPYFLHAGPGYGGSCFPKDTLGLVEIGKQHQIDLKIVKATIDVNDRQYQVIIEKLDTWFKGNFKEKIVAILGLSFKPNTDDVRMAPAINIIRELQSRGAMIQAFDPIAMNNMKLVFTGPEVHYKSDAYTAVEGADACILLTEWNDFRQLDVKKLKSLMRTPNMIDSRNVYDPSIFRENKFNYSGIGRA